jgi:hypothetical protein
VRTRTRFHFEAAAWACVVLFAATHAPSAESNGAGSNSAEPDGAARHDPASHERQAGKSPVLVFILAGQSNMEGQAVVDLDGKDYNDGRGTLVALLADSTKSPRWRHIRDDAGNWVVRDDVWVRYEPEEGSLQAGPLGIGFTAYGDTHHFGPELEFGHVVGDRFERQVLLIKTAWGGKSLYRDFRPPSSGGEVGPYYTKLVAQVRAALASLKEKFPAYDGGGCRLAGLVWYQGWNDGCDPQVAVPEYERNLVNLIRDVRRDLEAPDLPVVIGELTGPWVNAEGEWAALRKAQAAAAANPALEGLRPLRRDPRLREEARGVSLPDARPPRVRQRRDVPPRGEGARGRDGEAPPGAPARGRERLRRSPLPTAPRGSRAGASSSTTGCSSRSTRRSPTGLFSS